MTRSDILDTAKQYVCSDRNAQYGEPEDNFARIADYWSVYLSTNITAHDVAMLMTLFKVARIDSSPKKDDHYIDAAGYLACGGEIACKNLPA